MADRVRHVNLSPIHYRLRLPRNTKAHSFQSFLGNDFTPLSIYPNDMLNFSMIPIGIYRSFTISYGRTRREKQRLILPTYVADGSQK